MIKDCRASSRVNLHRSHVLRRDRFAIYAVQDTSTSEGLEHNVKLLHRAAVDPSADRKEVFDAMMALDKMKLSPDGLGSILSSPGRKWRLVYTAGKEAVRRPEGGAGMYFPLTAVQSWDSEGNIQNGVYLGHLAGLAFSGPYYISGRKLCFNFTKLTLKLGPFKPEFALKSAEETNAEFAEYEKKGGKGHDTPFFLFSYADEKVAVARGRGGGIAMWAAVSPSWQMEAGAM
eukprot:CAMPEP_0177607936 /NCGR_PEP_ID=MMETSP0419_2-20121207/18191_1 /TAXON_ID=582737 /ORGANISM="Tetraselmis sp., Strain GSL018" /LENGTH=230 /DNA_ID=CAMNT_0019102567 /DNA_START=172 /DNA_END=864 /DNA_ORIENTATION=+